MEEYIIGGGRKLYGNIEISPAKNSCLSIMAACVMLSGEIFLKDAPKISDISVMAEIIEDLGGKCEFSDGGVRILPATIKEYAPEPKICKKARASFFTAGALLSRFKRAIMPLPGGCDIGKRPVDIHISAMEQLGTTCEYIDDFVVFNGKKMKSGIVRLSYPSVGATVNTILASVFLKGETLIENAAKEPEISDLCGFLRTCGCNIIGDGKSIIRIVGCEKNECRPIIYRPIPDRIEAGTYMAAVSACGGELAFNFEPVKIIGSIAEKLMHGGVKIYFSDGKVRLYADKTFRNSNLVADVYPKFPTDMQPQYAALSITGRGTSVISDRVFKSRFSYAEQLKKSGADIKIEKEKIRIKGGKKIFGTEFSVGDLRGGAAMVIAALAAEGKSIVTNAEILRRGYCNMAEKLSSLGADIRVFAK